MGIESVFKHIACSVPVVVAANRDRIEADGSIVNGFRIIRVDGSDPATNGRLRLDEIRTKDWSCC